MRRKTPRGLEYLLAFRSHGKFKPLQMLRGGHDVNNVFVESIKC